MLRRSIYLICEHTIDINFALGYLCMEFLLKTATAATHKRTTLFSIEIYSDRLFSASGAREEFGQPFLGDMNHFSSSSTHQTAFGEATIVDWLFIFVIE